MIYSAHSPLLCFHLTLAPRALDLAVFVHACRVMTHVMHVHDVL